MFFLPLFDDNPTRRPAYVTWLLIGLCVGVFLWQSGLTDAQSRLISVQYGSIPALLLGGESLPAEYRAIPAWASPLTSMFLHGGFLHLGGNMLFLWIFGNNVEEAMGRVRYLLFYALCGYAAALFQSGLDTSSTVPMIGASGAIAGVLGAYALMYPRANVRTLVVVLVFFRIVSVPAAAILIGWFLMQTISGLQVPPGAQGGVAYFAHVGGFLAGAALIFAFKRGEVRLFQPAHSQAFEITPFRMPSQRTRRRRGVPDVGGSPWDRR
ncbi:rhomboid family intramembrane serine protease [Oleispirillum naphthae]|uniref:rhomboid family intramembrane serine protease n=1 Tax=Oleispirillum naphthae TaxID=2838853 RepID=UPI003082311F